SVIHDNITRSVYIRECSKMLEVDENILYGEVSKIKHKDDEAFVENEKRQAARAQINPQLAATLPEKKKKNLCDIEEKALLRILLRFHKEVIFNIEADDERSEIPVTVAEYILSELDRDNLTSSDPLIHQIIAEFREHYQEDFFNPERHFVQHENPEICNLVSGLLVDKYIESVIWKRKGSYVEDEHEILYLLVPRLVEEYKLRHVKIMIAGMMKQIGELQSSDDLERIMELQTLIQNLKKVEKELTKKLGKRAITI
ncbi:MAG TPA: hypothetical protein PKX60_01205, partial [Prolixibacteraceae bacterium]|nr:hypothetical protein [Prolixibacteraceae bacterium]